jgi:hypothetical protein
MIVVLPVQGGFTVQVDGANGPTLPTSQAARQAAGRLLEAEPQRNREDFLDLTGVPIATGDPVEVARQVHNGRACNLVDGVLLDSVSAAAIVAVADAVNAANLAKLKAMPLAKAAAVCLKVCSRYARS